MLVAAAFLCGAFYGVLYDRYRQKRARLRALNYMLDNGMAKLLADLRAEPIEECEWPWGQEELWDIGTSIAEKAYELNFGSTGEMDG
jgi:hypothetical protein